MITEQTGWLYSNGSAKDKDESMRIGLISDTHIPEAGPELWPQTYEAVSYTHLTLPTILLV